eukprot:scaffold40820_cov176-Amphora_coffeaeformis.AAC.2
MIDNLLEIASFPVGIASSTAFGCHGGCQGRSCSCCASVTSGSWFLGGRRIDRGVDTHLDASHPYLYILDVGLCAFAKACPPFPTKFKLLNPSFANKGEKILFVGFQSVWMNPNVLQLDVCIRSVVV